MTTFAIHMRPKGSLASTPLSSDTLFGAVCWGIQMLGLKDNLSTWLDEQRDHPEFAFSAAFPMLYNQRLNYLYFYPCPETFTISIGALNELVEDTVRIEGGSQKTAKIQLTDLAKKFNHLRYLSEAVFNQVMRGELTPVDVIKDLLFSHNTFGLYGDALLEKDEVDWVKKTKADLNTLIPTSIPVQHNQVDRVAGSTMEGQLFYQDEVFFPPHSGLWFLTRASDAHMKTLIEPALRYLADTGLGANRGVGKGHFDFSIQTGKTLPEADQPNGMMVLSRYLPAEDELKLLEGIQSAYRLTTLRPKRERKIVFSVVGQKTLPVYKQPIRVFEPGSVFPAGNKKDILGRIVQVVTAQDEGPIFQSGAAIPVFMRIQEE